MGRSYRPILRSAETCHGLGAARGLAYIAHVVDMKVDEFAESFLARYTGIRRRFTAIDLVLGFGRSIPVI